MLWSFKEKQVYIHFHFDIQLCFSSYFRSRPIVKNLMRNFFLVENGFKNSTKIPEEGKSIIKNLMRNFFSVENHFKNSTKSPEGKCIKKLDVVTIFSLMLEVDFNCAFLPILAHDVPRAIAMASLNQTFLRNIYF